MRRRSNRREPIKSGETTSPNTGEPNTRISLKCEWPVVVYSSDQDQLLNSFRIIQRTSCRDCATVRTTNKQSLA